MAGALAATAPWWEPGTRHAYHTNTYGHLIGEVVRRVSGEPCGRRLAALAGPLGADVHVGVPPAEQHRCAEVLFDATGPPAALDDCRGARGGRPHGDAELLQPARASPPWVWSTRRPGAAPRCRRPTGTARRAAWRASTPRCSSPGRLLSADLLAEATSAQSEGYCPILHEDVTFGLGLQTHGAPTPVRSEPGSFGHFGTGGAVGFADPVGGVAFGYVMNHVIPRWQSTRNRSLIDALYRSL